MKAAVADKLLPERRSENMRRIKSRNTSPELTVRRLLRALGHTGYRLHRKDLPGKPDIAFVGRRKAIIIHGCFWHGHDCKEGVREPKSNIDYWRPKIARNRERDALHDAAMKELGWITLTLWGCELKDEEVLAKRIRRFLSIR